MPILNTQRMVIWNEVILYIALCKKVDKQSRNQSASIYMERMRSKASLLVMSRIRRQTSDDVEVRVLNSNEKD